MRPNDIALSKVDAPGKAVTGRPPASVSHGSAMPGSGIGPVPMSPFSDWKRTWIPFGTIVGHQGWDADAQVDQHAIPKFAGDALGDDGLRVHSSALHDEVINQRSGRDHMVGRNDPNWHDVICRDEHRVSRHGHQWVEVPPREGVGEIAEVVADKACTSAKSARSAVSSR